jgi:hypothetical protein
MKATPPKGNEAKELALLELEIGKLVKRGRTDCSVLETKLEAVPSGGKPAQYELHLEKKLSAHGGQTANELEARIMRLEQVLGTSREALVSL